MESDGGGNWIPLQGVAYRVELPSGAAGEGRPTWAPRKGSTITSASGGGPIAIVGPRLEIFTPLGRPLQGPTPLQARPLAAGWLVVEEEDLLHMVMPDAGIEAHGPWGLRPHRCFTSEGKGAQLASVNGGTIAMLLSERKEVVAREPATGARRILGAPEATMEPECLLALPNMEAVVATREEIICLGARERRAKHTLGRIASLAAPPGRNGPLAIACSSGAIAVISSNLSERLATLRDDKASPPASYCWCGPDAVLAVEPDGELLLLGPSGVESEAEKPGIALAALPEPDGARALTPEASVFVSRVPRALEEALGVGSAFPAALLVDALKQFDQRSAGAHRALKVAGASKGGLRSAAMRCCEAALHAISPSDQRLLLRAASHGAAFCQEEEERLPKGHLHWACTRSRLLNALRRPGEGGIPTTYSQLEALPGKEGVFVRRLLLMKRHLLAIRVCQHIGREPAPALLDWGCLKVHSAERRQDEEVAGEITARLRSFQSPPFAEVANEAHKQGRHALAARLLEEERAPGKQVPLLSDFGEHERALARAVEAGEPDLIHLAVFNAWRHRPFSEVCSLLQTHHGAQSAFRSYCMKSDPEALRVFYDSCGDWAGLAELCFREAFSPPSVSDAGRSTARQLDKAAELFTRAKDSRSRSAEDAARIIRAQVRSRNSPFSFFFYL